MHYIYILSSEKDHNLYVGYSKDLRRRMREHELGNVTSTKHRRPLRLVCYEAYRTKG